MASRELFAAPPSWAAIVELGDPQPRLFGPGMEGTPAGPGAATGDRPEGTQRPGETPAPAPGLSYVPYLVLCAISRR